MMIKNVSNIYSNLNHNVINHNNNLLDALNQTNVYLTKNGENQLNEINSLKEDLDNHNKFIKLFMEQNKILEDLSKKQENEILDLNKKLNEYEADLSKKDNLLNQLNEKCDSLSESNSYLNEVNNSQSDEINQLKVENNYFKRVADTLSEENLIFKATADNQSDIINDLKKDFDFVNDKLKDYKVKYSEKSFDLNQANYKLNRLFKRNNRLVNDIEELGMLKEQLEQSNELILNLIETIGEKQIELDNLKKAYQNTVNIKYNLEQENVYLKNSIRINSDKKESNAENKLTGLFKIKKE